MPHLLRLFIGKKNFGPKKLWTSVKRNMHRLRNSHKREVLILVPQYVPIFHVFVLTLTLTLTLMQTCPR
jgi:hypothetical protein